MSDDLTLSPLRLASDEDLVRELKSRTDACLVVTLKHRGDEDFYYCDYHGLTTCIGLAERAKARLLKDVQETSRPVEDGEEF